MRAMKTFQDAEAILATKLPGYESRPQQQQLARSIEEAISTGSHLIAEAGCGTGKSLGYLIPAILSGRRTVVTTATKALQDQIANKDLPFLAESLGMEVSYALLKGRSNYLCQAKLIDDQGDAANEVRVFIGKTREAGGVWGGEREDLDFRMDDASWRNLTTSSDECPGKAECPFGETCYAEEAKAKARDAQVVVVNHALFLTDLVVGNAMLDDYQVLIADEAHELEEWAAGVLGQRITEASVLTLASQVKGFVSGLWPSDDPGATSVLTTISAVNAASVAFWPILEEGRIHPQTLLEHSDEWIALANALGDLSESLRGLSMDNLKGMDSRGSARWRILCRRADNLAERFADVIVAPQHMLVRWVEVEEIKYGINSGSERKILHTAPIEVGEILNNLVWSKTPSILVSATMGVNGSFDYVAGRLGLSDYKGIDVGTPFDYQGQSMLFFPGEDMPAPKGSDRNVWSTLATEKTRDLVMASGGRALLLFTSTSQMRSAYNSLKDRLPYNCYIQGGEMGNKELAAKFEEDTTSVLFALRSFFTGVDFQGETCSLVVIDKLPFPVPTEPITEARCEAIVSRGGSDFMDYTIPVMSLILQQGYGRLIRHRDDRGVVAILDPRLNTGWGQKIVKSLPDSPRTSSLDDVAKFFSEA